MSINPFTFGPPVNNPELFINRKNEIRQVVNRLLSIAHESISIVGERRIGKTSLLKHLSNPKVAANYGLDPNHYCLIYIDFQGLNNITPSRFWQRIFDLIKQNLSNHQILSSEKNISKRKEFDLFDLEDLFNRIKDRGINIVLFMDEFENITQNPNFAADFFGGLRSLAIHSGLSLVTATQRSLVDLCHSDEVKSSPFFNIFATSVLRPFTLEDALSLVEAYLQRTDIVCSQEEKEFIVELGGGHPFFLQMAGFYLLDEKIQGYSLEILYKRVLEDFIQQADSHYYYLWNNCSESEKVTLLTILASSKQLGGQGFSTRNRVNLRCNSPF